MDRHLRCRWFRLLENKKQPQYLHFNSHTNDLQSIMSSKYSGYQAMLSFQENPAEIGYGRKEM